MIKNKNSIFLFVILLSVIFDSIANQTHYLEHHQGYVQFDISMPIDATGFTLHGTNLKGGMAQFNDSGTLIVPLLAHEMGHLALPVAANANGVALITTTVNYDAIKLINPVGIDNFFIKVGIANRAQRVANLDPTVLKNGVYTWQLPIFAVGMENNNSDHHSNSAQLLLVSGIEKSNAMYTAPFYVYTHGYGSRSIVGHPIKTARLKDMLPEAYSDHYSGYASVDWIAFGDPATLQHGRGGSCRGSVNTFPAGPNFDYEQGTFQLPTMHTLWNGPQSSSCMIKGRRVSGCALASIASRFSYIAQKIRVPLNNKTVLYAEFGSAYRQLIPNNLCVADNNIYIGKLHHPARCRQQHFLPGGYIAPYFAIGYEFQLHHSRYSVRYIYIPLKENANRLAWGDAPQVQLYVTSVSGADAHLPIVEIRKNFHASLDTIRHIPAVYAILGKGFFVDAVRIPSLCEK